MAVHKLNRHASLRKDGPVQKQFICASCKQVAVTQRCEAICPPRTFTAEHQCPYNAVVNLDGEWLCQKHADLWVKSEGQAARENETN